MILEKIFTGKIRVQLLTKLLLNPASTVYLRGLERDLGVSSNTVRLELNKLSDMQLIQEHTETINTKTKQYIVNTKHPMFKSLRGVILQHVGLDQIIENVLDKLGNVEEVYLTGVLALGKNSPFVDLVLVGDIDKAYLYNLIEKSEVLIDKKAFYTGLDVFCLPSRHEPFGIVLLEAFCYGTPVVSSDSEGPKDIITPNFDAVLVGKGSAQELAYGLLHVIKNPELAAKMAANGFVKAKTQYSIESVSERIEQALVQVIARWKAHH